MTAQLLIHSRCCTDRLLSLAECHTLSGMLFIEVSVLEEGLLRSLEEGPFRSLEEGPIRSLDKGSLGGMGGVKPMSPVAVVSEEVLGLGNTACMGFQPVRKNQKTVMGIIKAMTKRMEREVFKLGIDNIELGLLKSKVNQSKASDSVTQGEQKTLSFKYRREHPDMEAQKDTEG